MVQRTRRRLCLGSAGRAATIVALTLGGGFGAAGPPTLPLQSNALEPMPLGVFDSAAEMAGEWLVVTGGFTRELEATPAIQVRHDVRGWRPIGTQLAAPRARHTQTTLADGRVLVVGGVTGKLSGDSQQALEALASAEVFHPLIAGSDVIELAEPLVGHTAHLLPDGRVAVVGGGWVRLFDPAEAAFTEAIRLARPRRRHAAVLWDRPDPLPSQAESESQRGEGDEPAYSLVEQELSIDLVPTARGASIGATMEPQRVETRAPAPPPAPRAHRLVLLIIGGEGEATVEEVDFAQRCTRLWPRQLPSPLTEAAAAACADGRVLVIGGVEAGGDESTGRTWWLSAEGGIESGPDLELAQGAAGAALFVDPADRSVSLLGGEERREDRISALGGGRLIRGGERVFSLALPRTAAPFARRCWIRFDARRIAAVGGYRFVASAEEAERAGLPIGVNVRDRVDVFLLPSPIGGD